MRSPERCLTVTETLLCSSSSRARRATDARTRPTLVDSGQRPAESRQRPLGFQYAFARRVPTRPDHECTIHNTERRKSNIAYEMLNSDAGYAVYECREESEFWISIFDFFGCWIWLISMILGPRCRDGKGSGGTYRRSNSIP